MQEVTINFSDNWFIPSSLLSEWRRKLLDQLVDIRLQSHVIEYKQHTPTSHSYISDELTYLGNVMNEKSKDFYKMHKTSVIQSVFEKKAIANVPLMFTRHCIKQSMGWCPKESKARMQYKEPLFLLYNNTKLKLEFDCKECEMKVFHQN